MERFDLTSLDPRASNFFGGVFDGRYLYIVPQSSGLVFRFDAEPAGSVPAQRNASFFSWDGGRAVYFCCANTRPSSSPDP